MRKFAIETRYKFQEIPSISKFFLFTYNRIPVAKSSPRAETIKREKKNTKWEGVVSKEEAASLDRSDQSEAPEFTHHSANVDVSNNIILEIIIFEHKKILRFWSILWLRKCYAGEIN